MKEKSTEDLLAIWTKNDRNEWSEGAFEAIRQVLTEREITIPEQNLPPDVQHKQEVAEQLKQLPSLPLKKAIRIERNFRAWSLLLVLWIFFGFLHIGNNFRFLNNYRTAISNIKMAASPSVTVKPEFAEILARLTPHLPALERLTLYFLVVTILSIPAWLFLFPIRKRFVLRKRQGPKLLLILLAVEGLVYLFGAILTFSIPLTDTMGLIDITTIRVLPGVLGTIMLLLVPFFGKTASLFYQYTALDPHCFTSQGVGVQVLSDKLGGEKVRELSSLAVFSLVLCLLPPVGLPMAIASVHKISKSDGHLYGKTLAWISVTINGLMLAMMIFGIIMGILGSK